MRRNGLPRALRLVRRPDFLACYERGRRYHSAHFVIFVLARAQGESRVGMAVSRKAGHAAARNRLKRLLREFYRLHREALPVDADIVTVAKKQAGEAGLNLRAVAAELLPPLRRAALMGRTLAAEGGAA